ncbi:MAG: UDP-3-O-(3-hydroxymyristoyl)glucosamine N-acyltransferase [Burkholderiaceae bacterium]
MTPVSWSLAELSSAVSKLSAGRLEATLVGPSDIELTSVAALSSATRCHLAFLANPMYRSDALTSKAGAIVLNAAELAAMQPLSQALPTAVVCEEPYAWFAFAAQLMHPTTAVAPGIHQGAHVSPRARVHASARVDHGATIEDDSVVGEHVWIGSGVTVGAHAVIGDQTRIYPHATVLDRCQIGQRCIVHSGAVIGSDGFGFAPLDGRWIKIPQVGAVVIGNDVEIGANTTIDRGAMGDTIVEDGVKLDNQIQIAHNCVIGAHTVIAACVGIAGSARIGRGCRIGGAAMIGGHLSIADGTSIGPATPVPSSVDQAGHYTAFFPIMKHREWERAAAVVRNLPELRSRVRKLESEHDAAKSNLGEAK